MNFKFHSITFKVVVSIILFSVVFISLMIFFVQNIFQKAYLAQEQEKVSIIKKYIQPSISLNLSYGFENAINEVAEKALKNHNVLLIQVETKDKNLTYTHGDTTIETYLKNHELVSKAQLKDPATHKEIGKITVVYSNKSLKAHIKEFNQWFSIGIFIFLLFIIFLTSILYHSLKELLILDDSLKSFSPENPQKLNLSTHTEDEIGSISQSANSMIENIIRYLNKVQYLNNKLQQSKMHLKDAQRIAKVGSIDYDITNNIFILSDEYYRILGVNLHQKFTLFSLLRLIHRDDLSRVMNILKSAIKNGSNFEVNYSIVTNKNRILHLYTKGKVRKKKNGSSKLTAVSMDVTADVENKKIIEKLAYYDALTGLANRVLLKDRMMQSVKLAQRNKGKVAVIFLDLDHFKLINDTLGHSVGDKLLIYVSKLLKGALRDADTLSRFGGDEFVILLPSIEKEDDVYNVAEKIQLALQKKHTLGIHELYITSSIGFSIFPEHGDDCDTLIRNADTAMYEAKNSGRNRYQIYSQTMGDYIDKQLNLEQDLIEAVKSKSQIEVYYQVKVDAESKIIKGAEALVRWNHPTKGLIFPDDFIHIAESTGLMIELGNIITEQAIIAIHELNQQNILGLKIAINLSARQFQDSNLISFISSMFEKYQIDPAQVEFEITETISMTNMDNTLRILSELRAIGVSVAIDDFGTGHSSLAYLKKFPINTLKIDQSFVMNIVNNEEDRIIVQTIISMAHTLGLTTVAEGVEELEHVSMLYDMECDLLQGYYYSKPISKKDFFHYINTYELNK